jgi:hypothetical protein
MLVVEAADHQRECFRHGRDVGGNVEGIGCDQKKHQRQHQPTRHHFHHIGRKALARHPADQCAHELDRDHEGNGEEDRPQQAVAELRAGLRVGRNARRVVVRRAGH